MAYGRIITCGHLCYVSQSVACQLRNILRASSQVLSWVTTWFQGQFVVTEVYVRMLINSMCGCMLFLSMIGMLQGQLQGSPVYEEAGGTSPYKLP